jgi:hypothetical protein
MPWAFFSSETRDGTRELMQTVSDALLLMDEEAEAEIEVEALAEPEDADS